MVGYCMIARISALRNALSPDQVAKMPWPALLILGGLGEDRYLYASLSKLPVRGMEDSNWFNNIKYSQQSCSSHDLSPTSDSFIIISLLEAPRMPRNIITAQIY